MQGLKIRPASVRNKIRHSDRKGKKNTKQSKTVTAEYKYNVIALMN